MGLLDHWNPELGNRGDDLSAIAQDRARRDEGLTEGMLEDWHNESATDSIIRAQGEDED
jgi:hypothetical protein